MCGRFSLNCNTSDIVKEFNVDKALAELKPSYNIAPSQMVAAIINDGSNCLVQFKWGLIPSWAKDRAIGNKMINARGETLSEKPSFKNALKKNRCLIIADGFYEWKKEGKQKIPFYIRLKTKKPFGFAGLFDKWISPDGKEIKSCAIVTTQSNKLLKPVHHRMPVIIPKDKEGLWLDPAIEDIKETLPILNSYSSDEMEYYEVSKTVNSPANNSPECIKPD
ncbi:MAG TPA: SOS response-associated peptidase [Nitrospinota bacterium]|jgi:putative SOS response-associated peptidase YedK|nr:SOS response-associated peptidase [Nitrospinota bacterium]